MENLTKCRSGARTARVWYGAGEHQKEIGWVKVVWKYGVVRQVALKKRGRGDGDRRLANEIKKVLEGGPIPKRLICLDGSRLSDFARKVLMRCAGIRPKELMSYGELAKAVGKPRAARAVGQVMAHNPFPLLVPCHRVVAEDGRLGGFTGGLKMKRQLLECEGWRIVGKGFNARLVR